MNWQLAFVAGLGVFCVGLAIYTTMMAVKHTQNPIWVIITWAYTGLIFGLFVGVAPL